MSRIILGKRALSGLIEWILIALFAFGAVFTLSLPFTLTPIWRFFYASAPSAGTHRHMLIYFMCFGALMVPFTYLASRLFHSINVGDPFIERNITIFSRMAWLAVGVLLLSAWDLVSGFTFFSVAMCFVFFFIWAFMLVLRELFRRAVAFKRENEFTI